MALDRKSFGENVTDPPFESLLQEAARAMQPGLDGLRANTEEVCGLLDAHLLDHASDQHGSKGLRQLVNCPFQDELDFALSHGAFGIKLRGRIGKRDDLTLARRPAFDLGQVNTRTAAAESSQCLIEDDA